MTPELALVGYLPRDLLLDPAFVARSWDAVAALARDAARSAAGARRPARAESIRRRASAVQQRGAAPATAQLDQRFRKALLPTYDVFDEDRYFEPFHGPQMLDIGGRRLGISICEDIWNDRDFWKRRRYHHDPIDELVRAGADAIVNLSASPFTAGKHARREEMLGSMARRHHVPVSYVNQFGGNDDLVFDGRSCAFNAAARRSLAAVRSKAMSSSAISNARAADRAGDDLDVESEIWRALVLGTRDYVAQVRLQQRRARFVGRHRFGADRRDRGRRARRSECARRADAVAVFEPRQP